MSNRSIWKYPLRIDDFQWVDVPRISVPLSVQFQHGELCLWMLVTKSPTLPRGVHIVGTGHPMPAGVDRANFVGTVQQHDGQLIWHIFMDSPL